MKQIMPFFISPWPYRIIRLCLALIFIYAGAVKLIDPKAFARVISSYDLIPGSFLPFVAIGLPIFEVLAGIGLFLDLRGSLTVITGLLFMFFFVLGYGIANDMNIDCGCFGEVEIAAKNSLRTAFIRDLILIATVGFLYASRWVRTRYAVNENIIFTQNK
jgi:uncharacterized membrane protein YphA (DoxX/SURF4 family)